jgi:type II secretory pathway component GspD/PulD (secretin)
VILSGSVEEIGPAQEFLRKVDQPLADRSYRLFRLDYLSAAKIAALLPPEFRSLEPIIIPESNSFVVLLPEENRQSFADYLALVDRPAGSVSVKLKYLKAEDLLKKLPPSIAKEEILETGDPSVVFVRASADKLADFYRELKVLDKPVPQIRYQFLVVQYNQGESLDWGSSTGAGPTSERASSFLGTLGNLLNLNFDIVSTFGLQFAVKLNAQLSTNDAQIRADTALVGLSGQDLEFRNTETFRYQEVEVDEEGNQHFTGVTREITSGLIFKIQGWVSGDQMITMNVKATVSKRGAATSDTVGALPTTSENIVNTLARSSSGQPVVIGGLMRQETNIQVSKVPVLGSIPLLGYLFQSRKEVLDNSEIVIYIVPRVEYGEAEQADLGLTLERLYQRFFGS